jgi:hypothetical protein
MWRRKIRQACSAFHVARENSSGLLSLSCGAGKFAKINMHAGTKNKQ